MLVGSEYIDVGGQSFRVETIWSPKTDDGSIETFDTYVTRFENGELDPARALSLARPHPRDLRSPASSDAGASREPQSMRRTIMGRRKRVAGEERMLDGFEFHVTFLDGSAKWKRLRDLETGRELGDRLKDKPMSDIEADRFAYRLLESAQLQLEYGTLSVRRAETIDSARPVWR